MKLDDIKELLGMLREGNYLEVAARASGVKLDDVLADEQLAAEVEKAAAVGEAAHVRRIAGASTESWQAAAWLLERNAPERWARPTTRTLEDPVTPSDGLDQLAERRKTRRAGAAS